VKGYMFQVTDASGGAVADAAVVLRYPDEGPSATFLDGTHSAVVYTDASGKAFLSGIHWGGTPGPLAVRVTASKGTSHAGLLIEQTIKAAQAQSASKTIAPPADPVPAPSHPAAPPAEAAAVESVPARPGTPAILNRPELAASRPEKITSHASELLPVSVRNEPGVTVTSATPGKADHSNTKKWVIILAIAAGAGAGAAMAMRGKSSTSSPAASSAVSIGTPTVSVGNP